MGTVDIYFNKIESVLEKDRLKLLIINKIVVSEVNETGKSGS